MRRELLPYSPHVDIVRVIGGAQQHIRWSVPAQIHTW